MVTLKNNIQGVARQGVARIGSARQGMASFAMRVSTFLKKNINNTKSIEKEVIE